MKVRSWITATTFVGMIGLWGVMLNPTIAQVTSQVSEQDQAALEELERLTQQVEELYQQGKYDEAFLLAEKAIAIFRQQLGDSHIEIAPSLNNLARLYESQGRYAEAALLYEQALAIYKQQLGENHLDTGIGFNNLAGLYESQGRYAEAEVLHQKALAIFRQQLGSNHFNTAISLNNLAYLYYSQGRYTKAEPLYQEALAIFKQQLGDNHPDTAFTLSNLGLLYYSQGRYAEAEPLYKEALAIRKQQLGDNHPDTATSLNNLALLYKYQGRYAEAEPLYKEALAITKQQLGDNHPDTATSLHNLALLYHSQERYAEAAPLLVEALTIRIEQLGVNHPDTINTINNFTAFYDSQGKYAETEFLYQQVLAIRKQQLGENHPDTATSLNNLAYLYYSQKKYTKAEAHWQEALTIRKQQLGDNHPQIASNFNNLATLYQSQENISQAINYLTQGIAVEEYNISENLNIGDEKQKRDYMSTISGTTDRVISLNLQSALNNPQATQLALKTILQRKGRILDVLTNSLQILRERINDRESQELLQELEALKTKQSNLAFTSVDTFSSVEVYRQQLTEIQTKVKELEDKISRRSAEFRQLSQPITLEAIQQQIPNNSALVEIVRYRPFNVKDDSFGDSRYAVYILFSNGEIKAKDLGEATTIDDDLIYFRDNLRDEYTPIEQVKESSRELDAKLMQPIRELLGNTKTILLSPDGALNLIPFEALVDENNQYLVENYQISYLTSGRDLLRLKNKFASEQPPLILADPIYHQEGEKVTLNPNRSVDLSNFAFSRLPKTKIEGEAIQELLPQATLLTQSEATENVLKQVKRPDILHIATHGFFLESSTTNNNEQLPQNYENPLLKSGLVLAGVKVNNSAGDDGVLTALETTALNLVGTKLVVLSACDTGIGDITTGEGVYGLKRALVLAGSESQLISLWKVSDDATKDLMIAYYGRLQKGEGRRDALREIQLEMLKSKTQNHPFYWASFIPSGDWKPIKNIDK